MEWLFLAVIFGTAVWFYLSNEKTQQIERSLAPSGSSVLGALIGSHDGTMYLSSAAPAGEFRLHIYQNGLQFKTATDALTVFYDDLLFLRELSFGEGIAAKLATGDEWGLEFRMKTIELCSAVIAIRPDLAHKIVTRKRA